MTIHSEDLREKVARIIDPEAWVPMEDIIGVRNSFVKADEILSLVSSIKEGGGEVLSAVASGLTPLVASRVPEPGPATPSEDTLQARILPWLLECFGPTIPFDKQERGDRLLEEVFELLQSGDYDPARVSALRDYVWGRDAGDPQQEAGGVVLTLGGYCIAHGLDMHLAGEAELARVWTKVPQIRAKQAAKPTGSALPIAIEGPHHAPDTREGSKAEGHGRPNPESSDTTKEG